MNGPYKFNVLLAKLENAPLYNTINFQSLRGHRILGFCKKQTWFEKSFTTTDFTAQSLLLNFSNLPRSVLAT